MAKNTHLYMQSEIMYTIAMYDVDTRAFLKEREEKLGAPIVWKTYSMFFAQIGGEKREYGVFLYSDGDKIVIEDFERVPSIMGIALPSRRKPEEYIKMEITISIDDIKSVDIVTRSSAEASLSKVKDVSKIPNAISRFFRKTLTRVKLTNGDTLFLELMSHKEFSSWIESKKKER